MRRPAFRLLLPCLWMVCLTPLLLALPAGAQEKLDPDHSVTIFRLTDDGSITIKLSVQTAGSASYIAADGETLDLAGKPGSTFSFLIADYSEPLTVREDDGELVFEPIDGKPDEAKTAADLPLGSLVFKGEGAGFGPPKDKKMPIRFRIPKWFPVVGGCYFGASYDPHSKCTFMIVVCYGPNGNITKCRTGQGCGGGPWTYDDCHFHGFPGNGLPDWLPGPGNVNTVSGSSGPVSEATD